MVRILFFFSLKIHKNYVKNGTVCQNCFFKLIPGKANKKIVYIQKYNYHSRDFLMPVHLPKYSILKWVFFKLT